LDGNDEVRGLVAVVPYIPLRCSFCELIGQILFLLAFQMLDLLFDPVEFGLVISFLSLDGFEESLGDLHDGFWVADIDLEGCCGASG
jgi:hypothetical protein